MLAVIVQSDSGQGVNNGHVLVTVNPVNPEDHQAEYAYEVQVTDGNFVTDVERMDRPSRTRAYFLGEKQWMPCENQAIDID